MFKRSGFNPTNGTLPALAIAGGVLAVSMMGQPPSVSTAGTSRPPASASDGKPPAAGAPYRFQPTRMPRRVNEIYGLVWGVDDLSVKWAESGELIRFSYTVVDAAKAEIVNDKKSEPQLIDPEAGVSLVIPSLEKVGQLRQSSTPVEGKSYWMAFSNQGRRVKRGDRVEVVIGHFRATGLIVE
jgi:hypothetical protein